MKQSNKWKNTVKLKKIIIKYLHLLCTGLIDPRIGHHIDLILRLNEICDFTEKLKKIKFKS